MKQIYSEGRIVGLSAYELYVRQQLAEDPDATLPSEKEWLSAMLGNGNSMLLKIPAQTSAGWQDYVLPTTSFLAAANTIVASVFVGNAVFDGNWATKVTDYGDLIANAMSSDYEVCTAPYDGYYSAYDIAKIKGYPVVGVTPYQGYDAVLQAFNPDHDIHDVLEEGTTVYLPQAGSVIVAPTTPGLTVPAKIPQVIQDDQFTLSEDFKAIVLNYEKIVEGICFQPGEWNDYMRDGVAKEFHPDPSYTARVRIRLSSATTHDTYVLLQGFQSKIVLQGMTGFESGMDTALPEDGDFLGPMSYPWATKIVFIHSSEVDSVLNTSAYKRKLPSSDISRVVDSKPVIDFATTDPGTYYASTFTNSRIAVNVEDLNVQGQEGAAVIASYQKSANYPPALYAAKVTAEGEQTVAPVDVAAPGTVKLFKNQTSAQQYPGAINNVYGIYQSAQNTLHLYDEDNASINLSSLVTVAHVQSGSYTKYNGRTAQTGTFNYYTTTTKSGDDSIINPSLVSAVNGNAFDLTGSSGEDVVDEIPAGLIFTDAAQNRKIRIIRDDLKKFRDDHLATITTDGKIRSISVETATINNLTATNVNETTVTQTGVTQTNVTATNWSGSNVTASDGYIIFNGVRLYISSTAPTGSIPAGSIGIGW